MLVRFLTPVLLLGLDITISDNLYLGEGSLLVISHSHEKNSCSLFDFIIVVIIIIVVFRCELFNTFLDQYLRSIA